MRIEYSIHSSNSESVANAIDGYILSIYDIQLQLYSSAVISAIYLCYMRTLAMAAFRLLFLQRDVHTA